MLLIMDNENWMYLRWRKFSEYQNFFLYNTLKLVLKQGYYRTFVGSSSSSSPFLSASYSRVLLDISSSTPQFIFFPCFVSLCHSTLFCQGQCSLKNWWDCRTSKRHWNSFIPFISLLFNPRNWQTCWPRKDMWIYTHKHTI